MTKKGAFYGQFFNTFGQRIHGSDVVFGYLIGTKPHEGQRDVFIAAATPPQSAPDDGEPVPPPKDIVAHIKSKAGGAYVKWAQQHAKALKKTLPGGLDVCGCFLVAGDAAAKECAGQLATALKGVDEPLVLSVDSGKLGWWQLDTSPKPALRPAQLKAAQFKDAVTLWAAVPLDVEIPREADEDGDANANLVAGFRAAVSARLEDGFVGLGTGQGPASVVDFGSEVSLASALPKQGGETVQCSFLRGCTVADVPRGGANDPLRVRCFAVATAAFTATGVELRHAVATLRNALIDSAVERLELAMEEGEEWSASDSSTPLQLPWRACCRPQAADHLPIWCADVCMPDETADAARERLGQLLGQPQSALDLAPPHLDERKWLEQEHPGTYAPLGGRKAAQGGAGARKAGVPVAACGAAAVALLLAAAVPFLLRT